MKIEQEALDLINEVFEEREYPGDSYINRTSNSYHEALCRALEAHANTRQDMSDAVEHYLDQWRNQTPSREVFACQFGSFIIAKPDPLVDEVRALDRIRWILACHLMPRWMLKEILRAYAELDALRAKDTPNDQDH